MSTNSIFEIQPTPCSIYATISSKVTWLLGGHLSPRSSHATRSLQRGRIFRVTLYSFPTLQLITTAHVPSPWSTGTYKTQWHFSLMLLTRSLHHSLCFSLELLAGSTNVLQPPTIFVRPCQHCAKGSENLFALTKRHQGALEGVRIEP